MKSETIRRAFEVMRAHDDGLGFRQIAVAMDPPMSPTRAHQLYGIALTELAKLASGEDRKAALRRLDNIAAEAWAVVRTEHVHVTPKGTVAFHDGRAVLDDKPKLEALNTLIRVEQRRAKLLGLDAPTRHEVVTIDQLDAEIERLVGALGDTGSRIAVESGYRTTPATGHGGS